ncbi:hypothetical protein ACFQ4C_10665 [Larkinella insperata]|uniref:Uncharacterized protein n=1 Tax=Larkinella insperata TaxID=332158 RepID=A0ABW3Q6V0_9BACT|nr:hypothetical protein [Larkinella insperata]
MDLSTGRFSKTISHEKSPSPIQFLAALSYHDLPSNAATHPFSNPIKDLGWLEDTLANYDRYPGSLVVMQATYQKQPVFWINTFSRPDGGIATMYRCNGSILCKFSFTRWGESGGCGAIFKALKCSKMIYEEKR